MSYQVAQRHKQERVTGVGRVIEEVMTRLAQFPELELNILGLYKHDVCSIETDWATKDYWSHHDVRDNSAYCPIYKSRFGLASALSPCLMKFEKADATGKAKKGGKALPARLSRKFLRTIANFDSTTDARLGKMDVFHSTFNPLPDKSLTGDAGRLITIYDIIPLKHSVGIDPTFWRRIVESVDKNTDWIVAISQFSKEEFCEYANFPAERAFVAPLAADDSLMPVTDPSIIEACRKKYNIPDAPYLLSVSNPQPRKNIPHLVRSFFELVKAQPDLDVNLVLAGSHSLGWGTNSIFEAIQSEPALKHRVHITGYVDEQDLAALYSGALAFIFPSLQEGFGLPVLEAMQCGAPIICSNTTSLPEVVGDAASLVDPGDSASLCAAMLKLVENQEIRERMSSASITQASLFKWDYTAAEIARVYKLMRSIT